MNKLYKRSIKAFAIGGVLLTLNGCSTISGWFSDEEELEIRQLPPLEMTFQNQVLWSESVGDGVENFFSRLQPAVAYNKIFVADREGLIKALDPETGDTIWRQRISTKSKVSKASNLFGLFAGQVSAKVSGGLTAAQDTIFFGTEDGEVYALEQATGEIKWRASVPSEVVAPPAVDAGVVIVNTVSGALLGIDATTGEVKWQNDSDVPPLSIRGISTPVAAAGGAIVGLANGRVRVAILESGLTAWEQVIAKPAGATELERIVDVDSKPLVFGPTVFVVSYGGTLSAIELRTGNVVWNREYGSYRDIAIAGNRLFVTDNSGNLYAIDRRNGIELWSNGALRKRNLTSATVVGNYIVAGDKFGFLHYFTQDEGQYVSRIAVGDDDEDEAIYAAPVFADNIFVVQTRDGVIKRLSVPE